MKVTLCIGSSCHLKGSKQVLEQLQQLISDNNLGNKVELGATAKKAFASPLTETSFP